MRCRVAGVGLVPSLFFTKIMMAICKNGRTRVTPVLAQIDRLEPRRLFFAAADYYPLVPGTTWQYSGSLIDEPVTASETVVADTLNGVPREGIALLLEDAGGPAIRGGALLPA